MSKNGNTPNRAHVSRSAIQKLHIAMRHLFIRGSYKPLGMSGEAMIDSMLELEPEIYGSINDDERVELSGLLYIFQRLPVGIESSRYVKLIAKEGYENSHFTPIIPDKRRRKCYRIDEEQMFIEMTRGRSDIYDVLTHLTFMYIESEKIRRNSLDSKNRKKRSWLMLENIVETMDRGDKFQEEVGFTYLSSILGRTYDEVATAYKTFKAATGVSSLFHITYWMGKRSMEEHINEVDREISFSSSLRESLGHHTYGEYWAQQIKSYLDENDFLEKDIHIISSNLHSVSNSLYGRQAVSPKSKDQNLHDLAESLSLSQNENLRKKVTSYALKNGMKFLEDNNGTNIGVQIIDCSLLKPSEIIKDINLGDNYKNTVIIVMDYAFGEQAFETMDELLKQYNNGEKKISMNIKSISIMGKAGILKGRKGDIMIPTSHVFEGTADNYPVENQLTKEMFKDDEIDSYEGTMVTVLGTSLQNRDILSYFLNSSWNAVGLEMEGAHYQKAIQSASKIRQSISSDVKVRYAYYASDNPLETGSTLASGSLGLEGVKPTYMITCRMLNGIFSDK